MAKLVVPRAGWTRIFRLAMALITVAGVGGMLALFIAALNAPAHASVADGGAGLVPAQRAR